MLKDHITVGDWIAIAVALVSVTGAYYTLGTKVEANTQKIDNTISSSRQIKLDINDRIDKDIVKRLDHIQGQLDRLIDRELTKNGN